MENKKMLLLLSLFLIVLTGISSVSAADCDLAVIGNDSSIVGNDDLRSNSFSSLDNSYEDSAQDAYFGGDSEKISNSDDVYATGFKNVLKDANDGLAINSISASTGSSMDSLSLITGSGGKSLSLIAGFGEDKILGLDGDEGDGSSDIDGNDSQNKSDFMFVVNSDNFNIFFDESNILRPEYGGCTLVFEGEFNDMGIITIPSNDTLISARNSLFKNTVFDLNASGITLSNLNMVSNMEFPDNDYSLILVRGSNASIYNCSLDYDCPNMTTGFGIYSMGQKYDCDGLNVVNNSIRLTGRGLGPDYYNYAILLRETCDSVVYGNDIYCELPIKYILWTFEGSYGKASTDTVAALAADYCLNLTLSNNEIHTYVTDSYMNFPTLDTVVLYGCSYSLIENNTLLCEDYFTPKGSDNYLYVLDLYDMEEVTIVGNSISAFTNGGMPGSGTAYDIQVNGPVNHVKIAFNNLTTYNRGPNCGIYSNNYKGATSIDIISNFINVTGDATVGGWSPSYCLVSGIEVQDNKDTILNNTIIVYNLGDYTSRGNVYGISYIQSLKGGHSYNIQFNNITTNGNYGIRLIGDVNKSSTVNSTASNNILNTVTTSNKTGASTKNQVDVPTGTINKNNTNGKFKNNMSADYYPDWLKDYLDNTVDRISRDFSWITTAVNNASNGTGFSNDVGNDSGLVDNGGNGTIGNNSDGTDSLINNTGDVNGSSNGTANGTNPNPDDSTNATEGNGTNPNPVGPVNNTDVDPANVTDPVNSTDVEPINDTDVEPVNVTEPVDNTDVDSVNETVPVNNTEPEVPEDDKNINSTNVTEPIENTELNNMSNDTKIIENITNQTMIVDEDIDPEEPENNPSGEDKNYNPGDSGEDLSEANIDSPANDDVNKDIEDSDSSNEVSPSISSSKLADPSSSSSTSPGLSGASAANDAYELDKKVDVLISKSVDNLAVLAICVVGLFLILIGYKRQKNIEEED